MTEERTIRARETGVGGGRWEGGKGGKRNEVSETKRDLPPSSLLLFKPTHATYSLPDELPINFGSPLCTDANPTPFNKLSISLSLLLGSPECIDGEEVMDEWECIDC